MRNGLRQTLLFFTLIAVGTVKGDSPPTPSPEPLSIVLGDGSIIVEGDIILSIHGFTPFFDSQKGSVLLISDINEKNIIRLRADAGQSLVVTDSSGHLMHIDLQSLLEKKKAVFVPVNGSIRTEKTGQFFSGITVTAKELPAGLNGLPTSVFLQSSDYQKGSRREQYSGEQYSGSLTPAQAMFSLAGLGSKRNSPLPTSHGLLGVNDDKSLLSTFLDYPITPTFVEVTAFMNYENYSDTENVNDTMILLRFLVEKLKTVEMLYSLLMTNFSEDFLDEEEFKERFRMEDPHQSLKLESLYHFLVSSKQSEIDNASQTIDGATGSAPAALPESQNAVTALGCAIARSIRILFPENTDERINSILEQSLGPAVTREEMFSRFPHQDDEVLMAGILTASCLAMRHARHAAERAAIEESDEDETSSSSSSENSDFERWFEKRYGDKLN
ncbi:hypothetical protein [Endozoicomonas sp. 8E]|uniref:hypothetical protein n=1 Tax=Endozoicomonas sp. 8E TaxID=3035692 RepID=UPI002939253D|nr:hypothetical protein [Endozoicomonas sp. 8E]WOG28155.1 hypothetical protein P6910_00445 [Endozoicomonas sp. 8E]